MKKIYILLLLTVLPSIYSQTAFAKDEADAALVVREALMNSMPDLTKPVASWDDRAVTEASANADDIFLNPVDATLSSYRDQWKQIADWSGLHVWHRIGYIISNSAKNRSYRLGVNILLPKGPVRGTFLFVHGYMDNALSFSFTLEQFLRNGWAVVTLDLPGHGLSEGPRSDIADFRDYGDAVETWMNWAASLQKQMLPRPWVLTAFSLGGASTLEYYSRKPLIKPDRTILVAPLIRTVWYDAAIVGYYSFAWAIHTLPPLFAKSNYLSGSNFPVHWFHAYNEWESNLEHNQLPLSMPGLVLQGSQDQVMDVNYNMKYLRGILEDTQFLEYPGDHFMLRKPGPREQVQQVLDLYLKAERLE